MKNWIKINDQSREAHNVNGDIRFKTIMLKFSLSDYSDACILFKGRITIIGAEANAAARRADEIDKKYYLKNFTPFINCKTEINNTEIDNSKDNDIVMPM